MSIGFLESAQLSTLRWYFNFRFCCHQLFQYIGMKSVDSILPQVLTVDQILHGRLVSLERDCLGQ